MTNEPIIRGLAAHGISARDYLQSLSTGLDVKITQIVCHEADQPDTVGHLSDADQLAGEHGVEVDFAPFVADAAGVDLVCEIIETSIRSI